MIKNGALSCPECGSNDVSEQTQEIVDRGDKTVQVRGICNACGRVWRV